MLPLKNDVEREAVFALYTGYFNASAGRNVVSSHTIINSYLNDLTDFYWEIARRSQGYNVVFVDEMHLFNAQERMVFHYLLADPNPAVRVVMALDPSQSPRETFTKIYSNREEVRQDFLASAGLADAENMELTTVYRYTPQIHALIQTFMDVAPGLDLNEDWGVPLAHSSLPDGPTPRFQVLNNDLEMFRAAIGSALSKRNRRTRGGAKTSRGKISNDRIAILCLNYERFTKYKEAALGSEGAETARGQWKDKMFAITSREDTEKLKYEARKIVLSMPEYVAGLQFRMVLLLDANRYEVPEGPNSTYAVRRFLSEMYLGISRAQFDLEVYASNDQGGITPILNSAVKNGLLLPIAQNIEFRPDALPDA